MMYIVFDGRLPFCRKCGSMLESRTSPCWGCGNRTALDAMGPQQDRCTTWHIGNQNPFAGDGHDAVHRVVEIQVDGHELEYIQKNLGVAKEASGPAVRFFGAQAKFIAGNLPTIHKPRYL